jgi:hypothetical protein
MFYSFVTSLIICIIKCKKYLVGMIDKKEVHYYNVSSNKES